MIVIGYVLVIETVIRGSRRMIVVDVVVLSFRLKEHLSLGLQLHKTYGNEENKCHKNGTQL